MKAHQGGRHGCPRRLHCLAVERNVGEGGADRDLHLANTRFWVGYGFAAEQHDGVRLDDVSTRFELDVDGEPVSMLTEVRTEAGLPVRKSDIAEFPNGIPAGWHDFAGRWFDGGRLIISSRAAIQFVEA